MDVFLIPLGRDRYELYSEHPVELGETAGAPAPGIVGRALRKISVWLRASEERHRTPGPAATGWVSRMQERAVTWIVERIAEQRLLWNLRGTTSVTAVHPQDMAFEQVMSLIRGDLERDYDRHRRWVVIDGIAFAFTAIVLGPFFLLIPGVANLPAAYFAFRVFGHWMSMRGARQGLRHVHWTGRPCPPLSELRDAVMLEPAAREACVEEIAGRLHLEHLSTFFERMAVRPA
jgi:hypothetical protein